MSNIRIQDKNFKSAFTFSALLVSIMKPSSREGKNYDEFYYETVFWKKEKQTNRGSLPRDSTGIAINTR